MPCDLLVSRETAAAHPLCSVTPTLHIASPPTGLRVVLAPKHLMGNCEFHRNSYRGAKTRPPDASSRARTPRCATTYKQQPANKDDQKKVANNPASAPHHQKGVARAVSLTQPFHTTFRNAKLSLRNVAYATFTRNPYTQRCLRNLYTQPCLRNVASPPTA